MTAYVSPETISDVRDIAMANLTARMELGEACGCKFDGGALGESCMEHAVLGLLVPTVEAEAVPF